MKTSKNKSDEQQKLESEIYKTYYELNPEGDARFGLWKAVIDAKKSKNSIFALTEVLQQVKQGEW